jgi:hypothetical protein
MILEDSLVIYNILNLLKIIIIIIAPRQLVRNGFIGLLFSPTAFMLSNEVGA